jgi:aspartate-semialdehyde dehydrogenase
LPQAPPAALSKTPLPAPAKKYRVGVLGSTGAVGQRFIQYLEGHPWFEVTRLGASSRSEGKPYEVAANWGVSRDVPRFVRGMTVAACDPAQFKDVDLVFSALVRACVRARVPAAGG